MSKPHNAFTYNLLNMKYAKDNIKINFKDAYE